MFLIACVRLAGGGCWLIFSVVCAVATGRLVRRPFVSFPGFHEGQNVPAHFISVFQFHLAGQIVGYSLLEFWPAGR